MFDLKNVRRVTKGDLSKIKVVIDETELFPSEMLASMIEPAFAEPECKDIWVTYIHDGEPVGFAFCEPERMTNGTWNVLAIGVLPTLQGKGVGNFLMSHLEKHLKNNGQTTLIVETSGLPEFEPTRKFYKKIGYTLEARIRDFYDKGDDKIVFWKSLQ